MPSQHLIGDERAATLLTATAIDPKTVPRTFDIALRVLAAKPLAFIDERFFGKARAGNDACLTRVVDGAPSPLLQLAALKEGSVLRSALLRVQPENLPLSPVKADLLLIGLDDRLLSGTLSNLVAGARAAHVKTALAGHAALLEHGLPTRLALELARKRSLEAVIAAQIKAASGFGIEDFPLHHRRHAGTAELDELLSLGAFWTQGEMGGTIAAFGPEDLLEIAMGRTRVFAFDDGDVRCTVGMTVSPNGLEEDWAETADGEPLDAADAERVHAAIQEAVG